ncbi:MAG: polysaccharide biosynthesis C-terminal domain-containing protein [Bacteroidota bacterium]
MIEKIKELTKDTIIYGISTIVGRFLGFLLTPFYTNVFPPYENGVFSNIFAYIAFINIIFIYGMDAAFMKYYSLADEHDKKKIFSTPFLFVGLTSIFFSLCLFIFSGTFISLMEIPGKYSHLYYYIIPILLFDAVALVPFANLRMKRKAFKFTTIKIVNILINITLNFVLVLKFNYGIEAIFIANLIASVFSFAALLPDIIQSLELKVYKDILVKMIKFGIPYLPASLAAMIVQVVDRPIVLSLTDYDTVGIYQANHKLGVFMMLFVSMFQYAWQPFFLTNAREEKAKEIFSKILTLFLLAASFIWILLTLFVEDFARIEIFNKFHIIGSEFWGGLYIVPVILLAYLFNGLYVNFTAGIYIEEKTKYIPLVTGAGAAVNILLNFLLIPIIGIFGAAFAALTSYITMASGLFYFSQKFYMIKYEYKKIVKIIALIFCTGTVYYILLFNYGLELLSKMILLISFVTALIALRIVSKDELIKVSKILLRIK